MDKLKEEKYSNYPPLLPTPLPQSSDSQTMILLNLVSQVKMGINWKENACIVMYVNVIIRYCDFIFFNPS